MPLTNFISFNYIFASNEYQDKFLAYILMDLHFNKEKGSDSYTNLAVIPGLQPRLINKHTAINFTPTIGAPTSCPAINNLFWATQYEFNQFKPHQLCWSN
jgi:hypothetical protein